jgi:ABC-type transport system involved in Fe-S cluster assembly fused permease/ATPase subunit
MQLILFNVVPTFFDIIIALAVFIVKFEWILAVVIFLVMFAYGRRKITLFCVDYIDTISHA